VEANEELNFRARWAELRGKLEENEARYGGGSLQSGNAQAMSKDALRQLDAHLTALCQLYLSANAEQRQSLREFVQAAQSLPRHLLDLAARLCRFGVTAGASWLDLALAALSIEDNQTGYLDTYVLLGELYLEALREGLDPQPYLRRAATLSSDCPTQGPLAMRELLGGFENSAYWNQELAPRLPHARRRVVTL